MNRFLLLLMLSVSAVWSTDPELLELIEKVKASRQALRPQIRQFLANEEIQYFETKPNKPRKPTGSASYEVMQEGASVVYRQTARNGKPIPESKRQKMPVNRGEDRLGVTFDDFFVGREYSWRSSQTLAGRTMRVIEAKLADLNITSPDKKEISKGCDIVVWIDAERHWVMREEYTAAIPTRRLPLGSKITFTFAESQGLPLRTLTHLLRPMPKGVLRETEQRYSDYRKFVVDSSIRFEEPTEK